MPTGASRSSRALIFTVWSPRCRRHLLPFAWDASPAPSTAPPSSGPDARSPADILSVGDVVYARVLSLDGNRAQLALEQDSGVQGALLALDNPSGEIRAMVGGRDFEDSKFNRATQALRQTGSSFKPYVYTAAIDRGASPDDMVLDAPVTFPTASGAATRRTITTAGLKATSLCAMRWPTRATFRRSKWRSRSESTPSSITCTVSASPRRYSLTCRWRWARRRSRCWSRPPPIPRFPTTACASRRTRIRKVVDYDGHVLEETVPEVRDVISERTARVMTSMLQRGGAARHRLPGGQAQASAGRQNRDHE